MLEIFKMQLVQILGGKMKWLVVVCLSLPVLLTFTARSAGGLSEIREEVRQNIEEEAFLQAGRLPDTAEVEQIHWDGTDKQFSQLHFTEDGLFTDEMFWYPDREIRRRKKAGRPTRKLKALAAYIRAWIGKGRYLVRNGELWRDTSKPDQRRWRVSLSSRAVDPVLEPTAEFTLEAISAIYHFLLYVQAISILLALFYGTSVLGHELDGKTLT